MPRRLLGRSRLPACLPWARFGGGGGAVLAWLSAARGAVYTGGAPAVVGRGAGWRGGLGCDACAGERVGVAALGGVATARRHTMAGVDKSSVAATSHTRAAAASTAMTRCNKHNLFVAIEHFNTADQLERHTGTPHTTMPTAMNCLLTCCLLRAFLLVLLRHCILVEFLCTLQHATQNLYTHSNAFDRIATILRRTL